jgi:hypothetical protein
MVDPQAPFAILASRKRSWKIVCDLEKRAIVLSSPFWLDLDTAGFTYRKWGVEQSCKPGDWAVDNEGDIHTIDRDVFAKTHRRVGPGRYVKITPVWAQVAATAGVVETKEGSSHYQKGDCQVYMHPDGTDAYCVRVDKFESMDEPDAPKGSASA